VTSSDTKLHSGEGTVGIEMVGDLFIHLASNTLERQGRMNIGPLQFGSRVSPRLKRGRTADTFQYLGISDDVKERLHMTSNRGCNNGGRSF
jgi:hypothetical protein